MSTTWAGFAGLVQASDAVCRELEQILKEEVLSVPHLHPNADGSVVTTVGLMLHTNADHLMIDDMLPSSPCYRSKQLTRGDILETVDGQQATPSNFKSLLIGSDVPGSLVTLGIIKGEASPISVSYQEACLETRLR